MKRLLFLLSALPLPGCDDGGSVPPDASTGIGSSSTSRAETSSTTEGPSETSATGSSSSTGDAGETSSSGGPGTSSSGTGDPPAACVAESESLCGNPAAIIRSSVRLPAGSEPIEGDLVFSLLHRRHGDPASGGHPHAIHRVPNITLVPDEAFVFELDMCDANAVMWSEENCEYNLVVSLDLDGDNGLGLGMLVPEAGEPTSMAVFDLSCHADGPTCLDFELSCLDGSACVAFESPGACTCAANACDSQAAICQL